MAIAHHTPGIAHVCEIAIDLQAIDGTTRRTQAVDFNPFCRAPIACLRYELLHISVTQQKSYASRGDQSRQNRGTGSPRWLTERRLCSAVIEYLSVLKRGADARFALCSSRS
jgi:hypothetical protein